MVDVVNDGGKVIARRSGDNDFLRTGLKVCRSFLFAGVETGTFQNNINVVFFPRNVLGVFFGVDFNLFAVDGDGIFAGGHFVGVFIFALGGIILQEMREHFRAGQIVNRNDFIPFRVKHLTERQTTDTTETVNTNFYCHW